MTAAVEPVPTDHEVVVPASTAPLAPQPRWWRALVPMLAVAIVAGLGVLVLFSGGHLPGHTGAAGSTPSSSPSQSASRISPVAVRAFDPPPGDGHESDDKVPLATDGNPSTSWFTDGYQHRADFGGLKQGVGLLLDLGRPVSLSDVRLVVPTPGEALQLRAAVGAATAPSTAAGYSVVASVPNATATTDIRVAHRVTARYWLVWLTRLAPDGDVFRGGISEIVLSG